MSAIYKFIFFISLLLICTYSRANDIDTTNTTGEISHQNNGEATKKEEFNAGKMIIEHILDAHEWHIVTVGEKSISLYLPVILYDNGKFHLFSSSKFYHWKSAYNGFKI